MAEEPDYESAFFNILRALEIITTSLTDDQVVASTKGHSHVAIAQNPSSKALDHLRRAAEEAGLSGFAFEYIPFGTLHRLGETKVRLQ